MLEDHNITDVPRDLVEDLSSAYVLGALNEDEAGLREFEALVESGDPALAATLEQMLEASAALALAAPQFEPPQSIKAELLARVEKLQTTQPRPKEAMRQSAPEAAMLKKRTRFFIGTSIFSGLLLCLLLALNVSKSAKLDRSNDLMRALLKQTDSLRQENAVMSSKTENDSIHTISESGPGVDRSLSHFFAMFSENDSRLVTLASSPLGTARQHLFFSPKQKMIALLRENLKSLDANKTYTLWATVGGKSPIAIGNFRVDTQKNSQIITFPTRLKTADSFSISVENGSGGNTRGNVIFTGEVPQKGIN